MGVIDVKGVRIGAGRPKTIVPIMDATLAELLASARRAVMAGADCVEWRADFLANLHDTNTLERTTRELSAALPATPLIATLRTEGQGGRLKPRDASEYEALVNAVIGAADLVDVELCAGDHAVSRLIEKAHAQGARVILSQHDFERTPPTDQMERLLLSMAEKGADIPKLAVMACCPADAARLLEATARAAEALDRPLLTIAMGDAGAVTRLVGESFGSALTFCSLGAASAPGQVGLAQAQLTLDALHAALAHSDDAASEGSR